VNLSGLQRINQYGGHLAFAATVFAAFLSVLPNALLSATLAALTLVCSVYMLVGTYGFEQIARWQSLPLALAYFVFQLALSTFAFYLSRGSGLWLMALPLVAHAVMVLPRWGALLFCALLVGLTTLNFGLIGGWAAASQVLTSYPAAVAFVALFTQVARDEQKARAKGDQLAAELREANRKLREYAAQVEDLATTQERNRLAREIHDSLGHYLTVINMQLSAAKATLETHDASRLPTAVAAVGKAQQLAQDGLADVRRSVAALRASPTEARPLPEAIAALVETSRAAGLATTYTVQGVVRPLSAPAELTLYRAAQEGLTNIRKHAQATQATLDLIYQADGTTLLVLNDNGVGATSASSGFGLVGLRERAQLLGGAVRTHSPPGAGFRLEVELPGQEMA